MGGLIGILYVLYYRVGVVSGRGGIIIINIGGRIGQFCINEVFVRLGVIYSNNINRSQLWWGWTSWT